LQYAAEGCNYGDIKIDGTQVVMRSVVSKRTVFDFKLDTVALCVVPTNNRDDVEVQFLEPEKADRHAHEDSLVQMTFHFPTGLEEEDEEGASAAEAFQRDVMNTGVIRSITGDIIAEFSKEQGNFVTPRGKYAIQVRPYPAIGSRYFLAFYVDFSISHGLVGHVAQMTSTYLHMQGAQYAYKIKYEDINSLFLLPKADGGRMAFVISLEKPIRQGNQKYQNLVLETHKVEHTMRLNLTEEEISTTYDGQLSAEMTMPMSSLIAKIFKVLSQKKVFIPKQFQSARDAFCVRCSIKASDGLLYPLAKSFIFIHKPTVIIKFEDIDYVEFKRYEPAANSATRNFDLAVYVKESAMAGADAKDKDREYVFMSIDRSEYASLSDYINTKEIKVKNLPEAGSSAAYGGKARMDELLGQLDGEGGDDSEGSDGSEDDGDYKSGASSHSGDSDDSGVEESGSEAGDAGSDDGESKKVSRAHPQVNAMLT
jgi:structure-specific recognition protein 1